MSSSRRLAAIMFTDIAGFTQLSSEDEKAALHLLDSQRMLLQPIVRQHDGTWLKEMGDGLLISFPSSTSAVQCAVKIQKSVQAHSKLNLRIGIHQGDVIVQGNDVFGDDVNIAARIEAIAPVGGIAISHKVQGDISGSPEFKTKYVGQPKLKGVKQKVEIYFMTSHGLPFTLSGQAKRIVDRHKYPRSIIISMLVVLLSVGWYFLDNRADQTERIAVLPLRNLSGDSTQEYLSNGITRDLIKMLSSYKPLQIIQPHSSMQYKDSSNFTSISKELNAEHLIDGNFAMKDDEIQMNVRLIQADGKETTWSQDFEGKLSGLMPLYGEVAKSIVQQIKSKLVKATENSDRQTQVDPKAYEAYYRGRVAWNEFGPQGFARSVKHFEKAIEIEPNWAPPYVGLADAIGMKAHGGRADPGDVFPIVLEKLNHALELDENLAEAHDLMARINWAYFWSPVTAERGFLKAIDLDPSWSDVRIVYSQLLCALGRHEEAVLQARKAVELDPLNYHASTQLAHRLAASGKIDEAIEMMTDALEKEPNFRLIHGSLMGLYRNKGDFSKALHHAQRSFELRGNHQFATALADKRPDEDYHSVMKRLAELYVAGADSMYVSPLRAAGLYGAAGEVESTLQWLEKALEIRETRIVYIMMPLGPYEHLKSNERFLNIIRKTNMIQ